MRRGWRDVAPGEPRERGGDGIAAASRAVPVADAYGCIGAAVDEGIAFAVRRRGAEIGAHTLGALLDVARGASGEDALVALLDHGIVLDTPAVVLKYLTRRALAARDNEGRKR